MNLLVNIFVIMAFAISREEAATMLHDCFVIHQPTYTECFTFNFAKTSYHNARLHCGLKGGYLIQIQDEYTWKLLIQRYLQNVTVTSSVWLGYELSRDGNLSPPKDMSNMTSYWSYEVDDFNSFRCLHAQGPSWKWSSEHCNEWHSSLCQYDITACDISAIEDQNAEIKSCFPTNEIPFNETINIQCASGYYLNTSTTITCRRGFWDDVQCIAGCPPPGKRHNAQLDETKQYYEIGGKVSYTCDEDYFSWEDYRINNFNLTCEPDSTWSDKNTGYCYHHQQFSVSAINFKSLNSDTVELDCELEAVGKSWFHKEGYATSVLNVTSSGNLIVNLKTKEDLQGVYMCAGKVQNRIEIGRKAFEFIPNSGCFWVEKDSWKDDVGVYENENVLLQCSQNCRNYSLKWFKDGKEIFSNAYHTIVSKSALFFPNISLVAEGTYTCQISHPTNTTIRYNISQDLIVTPTSESICGTKTFYLGKHTWHQPWLVVFLHTKDIPFCYGTLINNRWIITTASCAVRFKLKKKMGEIYAQLGQLTKTKFLIAKVKVHPLYTRGRGENNVGLVRLGGDYPVEFTDYILPACITSHDIGYVQKCDGITMLNGVVAGFVLSSSHVREKNIVDVDGMSLVSKKECRNSKSFDFADDQFCAKFSGEKENFVGDIGSPFLVYYKERYYLLGIYSSGDRDTRRGKYDYFTSIFHHYDWIKNISV